MLKSMTGYGRGEAVLNGRTVTVEVRSVNNRYLDCTVKMPRLYVFAEDRMKKTVQAAISRGKVDVFVTLENVQADQTAVTVNEALADSYYAALTALRDRYQLRDDISVSLLSRFADVLREEKTQEDVEAAAQDICTVLNTALEDFNAMRAREGEKLAQDVKNRADEIRRLLTLVEERSPQTVSEYRAKLAARMEEVLSNTQIEESRILTEAAIFADKVAVDEETVRLRSHLAQLDEMLASDVPIGRKLDFLIQEFNREANTIGSKCSDLTITRHVVDIKAEIEKIREQIQNVE